ncbi:ATP-binding cassette domain-containing protein [Actinosynnema sp. NPDC047251]|uniref:ABC transporter ATP-binding protein n=1 Tax=Saccharothrix espanaensis TaxID=103731 RepID=UPI001E56DDE1|nr:ATP-binding cassette domain-containing protein [Saccharothrix espanaensis]
MSVRSGAEAETSPGGTIRSATRPTMMGRPGKIVGGGRRGPVRPARGVGGRDRHPLGLLPWAALSQFSAASGLLPLGVMGGRPVKYPVADIPNFPLSLPPLPVGRVRVGSQSSCGGRNLLRVMGVSHHFGGVAALREVDVEFPTGVTAVLGPAGAGKSTLLGLLSTAIDVQSGSIAHDGVDSARDRRRYRRALGFLPQGFGLPGTLTVTECLTLAAWQRLVPRRARPAAVDAALRAADLVGKRDAKVAELPRGLRARVGLAQAIVHDPAVLLLDEPSADLDTRHGRLLRELVWLAGHGRTVVVGTRSPEVVSETAGRVLVLAGGVVRFHGTTAELTSGRGVRGPDIDAAYDDLLATGDAQ